MVAMCCHDAQSYAPYSNFLLLFTAHFTSDDTGCQRSNAGLQFFLIVKPIQNAQLSNCRQTLNMLFTSQWTGDDALPLRWGFIAGSHSQIHVSSPVVIIFKKNSGFLLSLSGMSWHVLTWISFCSSPSRQGISLVAITYIFILSFKMLWRSQIDSKCILNFTNSNFPVFWRQVPSLNPHIHLFCSSMDIPNVQHLLHYFWTPKTTQKPLFFQLPVLQKLPPTFWKFLYYFYQFKPPFYANMLCRYTKTANGTTHVRIQTHITTAQSHMSQPHAKQAVTQQPQYHLHSVVTVCVSSSSSIIFRHAIPLCYLNTTQHNTTTVTIKTVLFLQNLLYVSASKAIIMPSCSILVLPSFVHICNSCACCQSSWPNMYWIFVNTEMIFFYKISCVFDWIMYRIIQQCHLMVSLETIWSHHIFHHTAYTNWSFERRQTVSSLRYKINF